MQALEVLTRDARALALGEIVTTAAESEVARQMQICNACRYCEGFCGVFPAMTRRLEFGKAGLDTFQIAYAVDAARAGGVISVRLDRPDATPVNACRSSCTVISDVSTM